MAAAHGAATDDTRGMMVAIPSENWQRQFGQRTITQMTNLLLALAKQVDLDSFRKTANTPPSSEETKKKTNEAQAQTAMVQERRIPAGDVYPAYAGAFSASY